MIDTVILQIPIDYSAITNHSKFRPSTERILNNPEGFFKHTNNPTKKDRDKGIYKPKLTAIKRGGTIFLKIEFSAPKLLFNNNLDEINENGFDNVVETLQKRIEEMGVKIFAPLIKYAKVIGFHPSKNIPLSVGYTSSFAIRELSKINLTEKMDIQEVKFRNGGRLLDFYSNRHSAVFYDKINDLNKPTKRAIDKDQTKQQFSLFDRIKKEQKQFEVLRYEVRLSDRKKMKEILQMLGFQNNPPFKDIFRKDLCQKILNLYWDNYFKKNLFLFNVNSNPQKVLQMILMKYPKTKIKTAIFITGLNLLCKDNDGVRGFRNIAKNYRPKTNWTMLNNYLGKFEDKIFIHPAHGFIKDIERNLDEFKAFRIKNYSLDRFTPNGIMK